LRITRGLVDEIIENGMLSGFAFVNKNYLKSKVKFAGRPSRS